jgi:uncharacterized damage-inducible protein DinB
MSIELVRELWAYHHWANRRLFGVAVALGEDVVGREVGTQFSVPTLREMFVHLYGADRLWLDRWRGGSGGPGGPHYGLTITSLGEIRPLWDTLESEQRQFLDGLDVADLARVYQVKSPDGRMVPRTLGAMLLHVPNHATHHRSEVATMLTMVSGSPPDTGIMSYYRETADGGPRR